MLYVVVVLSLLSVAYAGTDERPKLHLPPIILNVVKQAATDCIKEVEASQEVADNFFKLKFGSDLPSKKFLYCISRKTNYSDEDGRLNDGFVSLFAGNDRKEDVQKVLEECNKNKEKTNVDTLYKTVQCFYKNTPVVLVV